MEDSKVGMGEIFRKRLVAGLRIGLVVSVVVILMGGGWLVWKREERWINPMGSGKVRRSKAGMEVVGFLPTWMVGKTRVYCEEIGQMIFLGIEVNEEGELVWDQQAKKIGSEGYLKMKRKFADCGGRNIVGIKLFEDKKLKKLLANSEGRRKLIEQVKAVAETGKFDGVNVDFEFQGDPLGVLEDEFYQLILEMKAAGLGSLSVDVFANTVIKGGLTETERLLKELDYLVVMAYDFHRPGSQYAGAVAPLGSPSGERNIMEVVDKVVGAGLDKKKIVLAFPLYGYEWKTETADLGSRAEEYVQMWSFNKTQMSNIKNQNFKNLFFNWDEVTMTPWVSWKETVRKSKVESLKVGKKWKKVTKYYDVEEIHQIYYENERSLRAKIDLARQVQFGGVGFWALGYEGMGGEVWKLVY